MRFSMRTPSCTRSTFTGPIESSIAVAPVFALSTYLGTKVVANGSTVKVLVDTRAASSSRHVRNLCSVPLDKQRTSVLQYVCSELEVQPMQFAIVLSLVLFISTALLLFQFLTGSLIGADDEGANRWPQRTHRAH